MADETKEMLVKENDDLLVMWQECQDNLDFWNKKQHDVCLCLDDNRLKQRMLSEGLRTTPKTDATITAEIQASKVVKVEPVKEVIEEVITP